jgi:glycosyltransferase involved in cell wall biosynthesis
MTRILHVNAADQRGGAAKAAYRLHLALKNAGLFSAMLVQEKQGKDPRVYGPETKIGKLLVKLLPYIDWFPVKFYKGANVYNFTSAIVPGAVIRKIKRIGADVIHLHWIANGFFQIEALRSLRNKPVVWTLHDSWAFTGGCHVPYECTRYLERCGKCPVLGSNTDYDLSRWVWRRKAKVLKGLDITIVTPSRWMGECARRSSLLKGMRVEVIPNGVDIETYKPLDQNFCREALSLPKDKKIILFGAMYSTSNKNKGFNYLVSALQRIAKTSYQNDVVAVVLGASSPEGEQDFGLDVRFLGHLHDETSMAIAYSSADVFVAPSIQENLSNMVLEAMACGVPCVAFDIGGMPDMIEHKRTGYLAQPYKVEDIEKGILWVVDHNECGSELSNFCRQKVEAEFSDINAAKQYSALYDELIRVESGGIGKGFGESA